MRLQPFLANEDVELGQQQITLWRVTTSLPLLDNRIKIRSGKTWDDSAIIGHKRQGDIVPGTCEGDWLALSHQDGYITCFTRDGKPVLEPLVGMRVLFPVRRDGGNAPMRREAAVIQEARDGGQKVRLRLPGLQQFDVPIEIIAGFLDEQFPAQRNTPQYSGSIRTSGSSLHNATDSLARSSPAFSTASVNTNERFLPSINLDQVALGAAAVAAGVLAIGGAGYLVATAAAGLVRFIAHNPRMTGAAVGGMMAMRHLDANLPSQGHQGSAAAGGTAPVAGSGGMMTAAPQVITSYSSDQCQICLEPMISMQRTALLVPCGHHCMHEVCFRQLHQSPSKQQCPLCRTLIEATVLI